MKECTQCYPGRFQFFTIGPIMIDSGIYLQFSCIFLFFCSEEPLKKITVARNFVSCERRRASAHMIQSSVEEFKHEKVLEKNKKTFF